MCDPSLFTEEYLENLNVSNLKVLLKEHKQGVSGRKSDLIERLLGVQKLWKSAVPSSKESSAVDSVDQALSQTPLGEDLPDPSLLKDWSENLSSVPPFTDSEIYNYVVLLKKSKRHLRSEVFYKDRHVHSLQINDISKDCSHCYIKCRVIPSLPKANAKDHPDHNVWVCLSKVSGAVYTANCSCTAG